jgi:methylmalonyl-CoA mutase
VFPYTRGNKACNCWLVRVDIKAGDADEANARAKALIAQGVDSIAFGIKGKLVTPEYIPALLNGIDAESVELNFNVCVGKVQLFTQLLVEYYRQRGFDLEKVRGSIGYDPIGKEMLSGKVNDSYTDVIKALVAETACMPKYRCIAVSSGKLGNAGAYITQELACALAWGNEYLQTMTDAGIDIDTAATKIKFKLGISSNFFMEIAKFRAARTLWAKIVEQYSPQCKCSNKMNIHAVTSTFNLTLFDPYVNMLRTQTEAMSAAIAGVESISVLPYDSVYETPTEFAERIAKNQQLILKHESHLDKVVDPAGGSYYIESLTRSIATEAWKIFL